jgi:hypothetical protein
MHHSQRFCHFSTASWKSCSVRVFNTACSSASIISIVSNSSLSVLSSIGEAEKSRRGPSQASRVGGGQQSCCSWSKIPWWKRKCEMVCCHDATASSFVAKIQGKVFAHFHTVTVRHHSSMRNWLFGLPGRIVCEQSPWCQRKWCACSWLCSSPLSPFSVMVSLDFSVGRIVALSQGHNHKSSSHHQW